jgi:hypothetical protein
MYTADLVKPTKELSKENVTFFRDRIKIKTRETLLDLILPKFSWKKTK